MPPSNSITTNYPFTNLNKLTIFETHHQSQESIKLIKILQIALFIVNTIYICCISICCTCYVVFVSYALYSVCQSDNVSSERWRCTADPCTPSCLMNGSYYNIGHRLQSDLITWYVCTRVTNCLNVCWCNTTIFFVKIWLN